MMLSWYKKTPQRDIRAEKEAALAGHATYRIRGLPFGRWVVEKAYAYDNGEYVEVAWVGLGGGLMCGGAQHESKAGALEYLNRLVNPDITEYDGPPIVERKKSTISADKIKVTSL